MKENSIKEDIILLKDFTEGNFKRNKLENYKGSYKMGYFYYKDIQQAIERVLSDYTRLLKENEKLKRKNEELKVLEDDIQDKNIAYLDEPEFDEKYITKQKIKDKIEEYKNILKICNKAKDIDRIKAINERILELQELIEREK